jgi:hypothetical protein
MVNGTSITTLIRILTYLNVKVKHLFLKIVNEILELISAHFILHRPVACATHF